MSIITPSMFYELLKNLISQFFTDDYALCATAADFSNQLENDIQRFFSISVIYAELDDFDVLGILTDDTKNENEKNTYTLTIAFNKKKFSGEVIKLNLAVILSHEICHFVFFYELFVKLMNNKSNDVYHDFKRMIFEIFETDIVGTDSFLHHTPVDTHRFSDYKEISNIIALFKEYEADHFTHNMNSEIDFRSFFNHFLTHLKI